MSHELPIIRIELERMSHSILHAFSEHHLEVSGEIKRALEAYLQTDNLQRVMEQQVTGAINGAIAREVENFFKYGAGRKAIAQAVSKQLSVEE